MRGREHDPAQRPPGPCQISDGRRRQDTYPDGIDPAAQMPAQMAASSMSPESRVSRPTTIVPLLRRAPCKYSAPARPRRTPFLASPGSDSPGHAHHRCRRDGFQQSRVRSSVVRTTVWSDALPLWPLLTMASISGPSRTSRSSKPSARSRVYRCAAATNPWSAGNSPSPGG